ncbi:hypothetical protein DAEQUDRAFT_769628 [Daedalea quercina L-15889]|uniref:CxC1-like cysteine cluster associated with KDZ transposases domain-containing protein n=1 Tax=Daedalea quercina L-15889 TaxID=1314783 RepID=A0A165LJN5_9APHY|nr:hypothetical protein DAEQUDRAFT_769628 [Daedalea quercina L-15889]
MVSYQKKHKVKVNTVIGGRTGATRKTSTVTGIANANEEAQQRIRQQRELLSGSSRAALSELQGDTTPVEDQAASAPDMPDIPMDVVGAEGEETAGWEDEKEENGFTQAVRDLIGWRYQRQRKDVRTWRQRLERLDFNWKQTLPSLVNAYICWKHSPLPPEAPGQVYLGPQLEIDVFDIYTLRSTAIIPQTSNVESTATMLISAGYLGTSPVKPSLAISLRMLELLRRLRLFKASYSIEGFAKLLCYYYTIPYRRHYHTILADSYEIYLTILRGVQVTVDASLGQNTPNWRVLNACPACSYKLQDEPDLHWTRMFCLDGNNSLKRIACVGDRQQSDRRVFESSDYYLPTTFC